MALHNTWGEEASRATARIQAHDLSKTYGFCVWHRRRWQTLHQMGSNVLRFVLVCTLATEGELEKSGLVKKLKDALGDLVEEVKVSDRLVDSPVCFVQKGEEISPQMRNFFKQMGQPVPEEKRVMEINPENPLIQKIAEESEKPDFNAADWSSVLMGLASIADGEPVTDGKKFTALVTKLLEK